MCGRAASSTLATSTAATALSVGLEETRHLFSAEEKAIAANSPAQIGESVAVAPNETKAKDMPNAGPGNEFHVFRRSKNGTIQRERMIWGLIPNNGTEHKPHLLPTDSKFSVSPHYAMFNARAETLCEKPSFRGLIRNGQTCVVALDGYYEWCQRPHEKRKQPYFIRYKNRERPLLMAGVWSRVKTGRAMQTAGSAGVEGETLASFAILTTDAHYKYAWLHPRQPVILWDISVALQWLMRPNRSLVEKLRSVPMNGTPNGDQKQQSIWESSFLSVYPVTTKMNECKYQGDDCMSEVRLEIARSIASFFLPRGSKKARTEANFDQSSDSSTKPLSKTKRESAINEIIKEANSQNDEAKETSWTCYRCTFTHIGSVKSQYLACEVCQAERNSS